MTCFWTEADLCSACDAATVPATFATVANFVLSRPAVVPSAANRAAVSVLQHSSQRPRAGQLWTEHPDSRQATKQDLVDIARALGLDNLAELSVPQIRAELRRILEP